MGVRPDLRVAGIEDDPFLRHLFAATHAEFGALPRGLAGVILDQQYEMRQRHYRSRFPALVDHVVVVEGRPAGRLSTAEIDDGAVVVVVDLAVLPAEQGRGVASTVLRRLLARTDERRASVELSVARDSAAVDLYSRLGFVSSAHPDNAAYLRMRRAPGGSGSEAVGERSEAGGGEEPPNRDRPAGGADGAGTSHADDPRG